MTKSTFPIRLVMRRTAPGKTPKHVANSPLDCLADAKAARRFLRSQADFLKIDPARIAASGSSAGGHLAVALATLDGFEDPKADSSVSCEPNALVLFYPAFDLVSGWKDGGAWCAKTGIDSKEFSPALSAKKNLPPTLIMAGADEPISTRGTNLAFIKRMKAIGSEADLHIFTGKNHTLFKRSPDDPHFQSALLLTTLFFQHLGWIESRPLPALPDVKSEHVGPRD